MAKYIQISVELNDAPYAITRQLQIPADTDLHQLHYYLQLAMGWQLSHLHSFITNSGNFTDYEDDFEDSNDLMEFGVPVSQVLNAQQPQINYWYDYGDDWMHTVRFEGSMIVPDDHGVTLLSAQGVCPQEDSGGVYHLRKNNRPVNSALIQERLTRFYQLTVRENYAPQPAFVAVMENQPIDHTEQDVTLPIIADTIKAYCDDVSKKLEQTFGFRTFNDFNLNPFTHEPYRLGPPQPELAAQSPLMRALQPLFEALLQGPVKFTSAGYLPVSLVKVMYEILAEDPGIPMIREWQLESPSSESKVTSVNTLRTLLAFSSLAKASKTKLELTAKGRRQLQQGNTSAIYVELLKAAFLKFNWCSFLYDDKLPRQQHVAPFVMLQNYVSPPLELPDEVIWVALSSMVPSIGNEPIEREPWEWRSSNEVRFQVFRSRYTFMFGLLGLWTHSAAKSMLASLRESRSISITPLCRSLVHGVTL